MTYTYKCGHAVQDSDSYRDSEKSDYADCPSCIARRAEGGDLTGSPRQIAWAKDIIAEIAGMEIEKTIVEKAIDDATRAAALAALEVFMAEKDASVWIDRQRYIKAAGHRAKKL